MSDEEGKEYHNFFKNYLNIDGGGRIFFATNFDCSPNGSPRLQLPLIVFNYGLVCSNQHWSKQIPYFHKMGYPILLHDYRGHFSSTLPNDNFESLTFKNFSRDIKTLIDHLQFPKVIMLGHSMGVNVTLEFAKHYPQYLQCAILISGSVLTPEATIFDSHVTEIMYPFLEWLALNYPETFNSAWKVNYRITLIQKFVRFGGFNTSRVPLSFVKLYLEKIAELGPDIFFWLFKQMKNHDVITHLEAIEIPTLIISGENDKVVPNHFQNTLRERLKYSEFYLVKDGSHVPQVDFPQIINERIKLFIDKQSL